MNMNEVVANRANEILGAPLGARHPVHPNDHVNLSQSTNDVFPSAIHLALLLELEGRLRPALKGLQGTFAGHAAAWGDLVKIGRTHLQDATPLTLGQEFSGYAGQLELAGRALAGAEDLLRELPLGGTAVGTGLHTRREYAGQAIALLAERTGLDLRPAPNRFAAMGGKEALIALGGALQTLAGALNKIANDVRWLASGPRCGIGELRIPENEPGSSIMPGKVNPTQCEALTMICARVLGNTVTLAAAGGAGNFELNVYMPVMAQAALESVALLAAGMERFRERCAAGITPDRERIAALLDRSLMLVTALNPHIGYDRAARIARRAFLDGTTLREAAPRLGGGDRRRIRPVGGAATDGGAPGRRGLNRGDGWIGPPLAGRI